MQNKHDKVVSCFTRHRDENRCPDHCTTKIARRDYNFFMERRHKESKIFSISVSKLYRTAAQKRKEIESRLEDPRRLPQSRR